MTEPTIICPNCKTDVKLTESLAATLSNMKNATRGHDRPVSVLLSVIPSKWFYYSAIGRNRERNFEAADFIKRWWPERSYWFSEI